MLCAQATDVVKYLEFKAVDGSFVMHKDKKIYKARSLPFPTAAPLKGAPRGCRSPQLLRRLRVAPRGCCSPVASPLIRPVR